MFSNNQFQTAYAQAAGLPFGVPSPTPAQREALAQQVMAAHPMELVDYLQILWDQAGVAGRPPFPQTTITAGTAFSAAVLTFGSAAGPSAWFHLIYAYLLENTRIYEIFERVIDRYNDGETLGLASPASRQWLQTTEALFYRQQTAHDHVPQTTLTSDMRSDGRAIRRNAYFRMFGMDLNHGTADNKPYVYSKPRLSNRDFVDVFESLLRELWIAIVHQSTTTADPTDPGAIANLAQRLFVMLSNRRLNATLTAEEFSAVATLDWLRLAVTFDSPIVQDLSASAASEAERLHKIAERVELPAHGKADDYFRLAEPAAVILRGIELGLLASAPAFLASATQPLLNTVITHWSNATGKVMKRQPQPVVAA